MIRRLLCLIPVVLLAPSLSGCVVVARQVAIERNKSSTAAHARQEFPAGTPVDTVRATLVGRGYACTDQSGATSPVLQCDPTKRTKAFFKGNWRLTFATRDGVIEDLRASRSPKPKAAKAPPPSGVSS